MDSKRVIIEDFLIECNYPSAKVFQLEESVLLSISDKVATKLYQLAAKKYEDIDFGGLENSKGNIDNWKEYETLKVSLWKKFEHNRDGYTYAKTDFIKKYTDLAKSEYRGRYGTNDLSNGIL